MDLEVDTDGLREAAGMLEAAETTLRLPACAVLGALDGCFGPSATGREAAGLLTRRAQQSVEALGSLAASVAALTDALTAAAALFDHLDLTAVGPR